MRKLFIFGLILTAVGLPWSTFLMSQGCFFILYAWLLTPVEGNFSFRKIGSNICHRLRLFLHDKTALIIASLFILHIIGCLWTSNFDYAGRDLRVKLPLLLLPVFISSMPQINSKEKDIILFSYIAAVTICSIEAFFEITNDNTNIDARLSAKIGHVRFCLNIVMAVFVSAYYIFFRKNKIWHKILFLTIIFWLILQLVIQESMTGFLIMIVAIPLLCIFYAIKHSHRTISTVLIISVISIIGISTWYLYDSIRDYYDVDFDIEKADKFTVQGNKYSFDFATFAIEDGQQPGVYLCDKELLQEWEKRTGEKIAKKSSEYHTLVRYLASKGLRGDAEGVCSLSDNDIENIKNGIANVRYAENPGLRTRISKILMGWESFKKGNPNGSSEFQRVEYIKASLKIFRHNLLFGVGTGDVRDAFNEYYDSVKSPLKPEYRNISHNQYLLFAVTFGLIGLAWFLFVILFPLTRRRNWNFLYLSFFLCMLLSMLVDDIIDVQAGVTMYALFNMLLLHREEQKKEEEYV